MTPFLAALPELVAVYGPWVLFALAVLETCFVTGLVVPSGMATAFATVLASTGGDLSYGVVALSAGSGAFVGDLIGYGIGRRGGEALRQGDGRVARTLRRHDRTTGRFLGRHPVYSVTVARLVAFVRTLMPLSSGMARLPLSRFVPFDLAGIVLWLGLYMGIGLLAGESWERASSVVGGVWAVVFVVAGALLWVRARTRGELARPPLDAAEGHAPAERAGEAPSGEATTAEAPSAEAPR